MAKSQRHKRIASKKAKKSHHQAKAKELNAPKQWTRNPSWRFCEEPKATFEQVLNTFELLENVLAYLPTHDLLHAQEVCFKMHSTIVQSPRLRKKLFLQSDYSYMSLWKVNKNKTKKHNQPIEIFQGEQRDYINQETGHEIRPSSLATIVLGVCIPKVINPLILDILPDLSDQLMPPSLVNRMLRESPGWGIQPERVHFRLDIRALSSNTAQAMFVSQPPTKCLLMRCSNAFCRQGKDMEVKNPHGIQIANLVKAWEEHEADHEAYQPQGTWLHILENCEGPHPVELELLDGLAITQAEQEIVEHGNQKATSMAHANPFAYRRAYPRSCAPFENQKVVPTPLTCSPCVDGTMKFIRD